MPPNDPDPMFAAFYERCDRPTTVTEFRCEGGEFHCEFPVGEPSAWMPAQPPPCIRREASRVYRWLIYVMLAGLLAFALCNKSCDGRAVQQVKGGSKG